MSKSLRILMTALLLTTSVIISEAQRIVGYLPSYRDPNLSTIRYSCVTDIYFSFINFDANGNLITGNESDQVFGFYMSRFTTVKSKCKPQTASGPNLWISVGGADDAGQRQARFATVCSVSSRRATLISQLITFANTHSLAGIDIDWEFPANDVTAKGNHQSFMAELRTAVNTYNTNNPTKTLKISMAVGGETNASLSVNSGHLAYCNAATMASVDYVHVMSYDLPASYGNDHTDVARSQEAVTNWQAYGGATNAPWAKMTIGIAFYGRNSGRTAEMEYNNLGATDAATAFNSTTGGLAGGYWFDSKKDCEDKIDWIMSKGGSGVLIWDIGQDRSDNNLQDAICAKMTSACTAPQPSLGTDKGVCMPGTISLNSNVTAASGRTFTWKENGVTLGSQTGPTLSKSTSGMAAGTYEYEVTVTATANSCSRTNKVKVVLSNPVTATGATVCGTGTATLNVTSTGGTYEWYDAASAGNKLHTGASYTTPSLSSTTNYWVQEATGSTTSYAGKTQVEGTANPPGWAIKSAAENGTRVNYGQKITLSQSATIESVMLFSTTASTMPYNNAKIIVYSGSDGATVVAESAPVSITTSPFTFPVNITLPSGTYFVGILAPGVDANTKALTLDIVGTQGTFTIPGVLTLHNKCFVGNFVGSGAEVNYYGQLYNWVVTTGVVNPCPRTQVVATVNPAANAGLAVTATSPICVGTNGTVTIASSESGISYQAYKGSTAVGAAVNGTGGNITLTIPTASLPAGANTITVQATKTGCGSVTLTNSASITVSPLPTTANAGPDQTICAATATLAGNTPAAGAGTWTVVSGTATITNASSPTTTITGLGSAAVTMRWTIASGACTASTDDVVITPSAAPTVANTGPDQTVCATTATLAANTATTGTGKWTVVSGTATITNVNSPTSTVTGLATGAATLRWTISNGSCTPSTDDVVITSTGGVTTANAGPDQTVCAATATLAANSATPSTGTWTVVSGTATITSVNSPTTTITGLGTGAVTLRWTITNGSCTPSTDDVVITRTAAPTTANAGPDQTVCATSATLAGNTPAAGTGTGTWTVVSGTATITNANSPTTTITGLGTGAVTLRWTIANGSCTPSTDDVVITATGGLTTANAGPDQTVCATTATLAANSAGTATGTWTVVSGTATITSANSPTTTITGLGTGAVTLRWTISNGSCTPSTDDVVITRTAAPTTANAGPDQTICATSATLAGNTPAAGTGTGTWTVVSGTATITNANSPTTTVTGIGVGAVTLRWTIANGSCTPSTDDVVITATGGLTTANAGPDQTVCATTATLAANSAGSATGTWTVVSGTATITSVNSPTTTITGLGAGAVTLRWTISNGSCTPSTDDVVITGTATPTTANAGPDQTICASSATLAGNIPTSGTGTWTVVSGTATIANANSPTTTISGLGATATLRWTISSGSCTPSVDEVTITIAGTVTTPNAGSDASICNVTTYTLAGNTAGAGETGTWTVVSGPGSIAAGTANTPAATLNITGTGAITLRWTISNGVCVPSPSDDVVITVNSTPTVSNAGPDQTICATTATLAGNTATSGTGAWSVVSGTATVTNPASPTSTVTGIGVGAVTLRWTISNASCTPSTDDVVITSTGGVTTANAGADQTICGTTATLAANTPTSGTGAWTVVSGTATITDATIPTSTITGLGSGAVTLRWTISSGSCTPSTDDVVITRTADPTTANAGPDQTICAATATLAGNTATSGTGAWTVVSGTATITNPASPTSTVTGIAGAVTLRWTISSGSCTPSTDDVVITSTGGLTTANAGPDQNVLVNNTTLAGNTPTSGNGLWTVVSGVATITNPTSATTTVTGLGSGNTVLRWTISNGSCTPSSDEVTINFGTKPDTKTINGPTSVLENQSGVTYSVSPAPAGSTYSWNLPAGAVITSSNADKSVITVTFGTTSGDVSLTETNAFGSTTSSLPVSVSQDNRPGPITGANPVNKGQTVTYCVPNVAGVTYTWDYDGPGVTMVNSTTNCITITFSNFATGGTLSVTGNNGSGESMPRTLDISVNGVTGIVKELEGVTLEAYPNPFEFISTIEFTLNSGATVDLTVYNMLGYKVKTILDGETLGSGQHTYELSEIPSGVYVVRMKIGNREKNIKVIKH